MPRSRTAWLANWLTTDESICYHDRVFTTTEIQGLLDHSNKAIGMSGPEVCLLYEQNQSSPWLVVHRDKSDALPAFAKIARGHVTISDEQLEKWWDERERLIGGIAGLHVSFEQLDNEATMENVWKHLLPDVKFDVERFRMLRGLNIQQNITARKVELWHSAQ